MTITNANEINATEASYVALNYICDMAGSDLVLHELYDYLSIDDVVSFLHDFINSYDIDTSDLDDDYIESLNKYYRLHC